MSQMEEKYKYFKYYERQLKELLGNYSIKSRLTKLLKISGVSKLLHVSKLIQISKLQTLYSSAVGDYINFSKAC